MKVKDIQDAIGQIFLARREQRSSGIGPVAAQPVTGCPTGPTCWSVGRARNWCPNPTQSDGSFSQHAPDGQERPGHYTVNGDSLILTYNATGRSATFSIRGIPYTSAPAWRGFATEGGRLPLRYLRRPRLSR